MNKVAVYPFNKITHALIRFRDLLDFEISSVIDFTLDIGKDAGEEINGKKSGIIITNNLDEAFKDIDTLIINDPGTPMDSFEEFYLKHNLREKWIDLLKNAAKQKIRIISTHEIFDKSLIEELKENKINISINYQTKKEILNFIESKKDIEIRKDDSMRRIGIFATGSCIGKFTAQMSLYRELRKRSKADVIITEPTGFCFKKPQVANIRLDNKDTANYLQAILKEYKEKEIENVIIADQGGISSTAGLEWICSKMTLLKGFMPNEAILVVGYNDNDFEIQNAIDILRLYSNIEKPLAILLPDKVQTEYGEYKILSKKEIDRRIEYLKERFKIENVGLIHEMAKRISKQLTWRKRYYEEIMRGKNIKKAVIYPFGKIGRGIYKAVKELELWYEVSGVIDFDKEMIGKDAGEICGIDKSELIITDDIEKEISNADTLILTDASGINDFFSYKHKQLKTTEKFKRVVSTAVKQKKNIYSVITDINLYLEDDEKKDLWENDVTLAYPLSDSSKYKDSIEEKEWYYDIKTPVIGVFGTSPYQGKLTTQLNLKKELINQGLKVGHIGTEPSSYLFGADEMWVNSDVRFKLSLYRHLMRETDKKGYDCILVGGQSGIVPYKLNVNSNSLTLPSINYLFAANPDLYILVVNHTDTIEHIRNSINGIEALGKNKVLALVLPNIKAIGKNEWHESIYKKVTDIDMDKKKKELSNLFNLSVIDINNNENLKILGNEIIKKITKK